MILDKLLIPVALFTLKSEIHAHESNTLLNNLKDQKIMVSQDSLQNKRIKDAVQKIVVEKLGIEESEVNWEASFTMDLGADSLDVVELILEFEKEFSISIPNVVAEHVQTVGQAIETIGSIIRD